MPEVEELVARASRMGERFAKSEAEVAEPVAAPIKEPSGYVDLIFEQGKILNIVDARGLDTEIGNWLVDGDRQVLRIAWPVGQDLPDPGKPGHRKSHRHGHATEVKAALSLPKDDTQKKQVLGVFIADYRAGGIGLIDEDLVARSGLVFGSAGPRRLNLVEEGWLRASQHPGRTSKNKDAIRWELTPAALKKLGMKERD